MKRVAIAGASGFVGRALVEALAVEHEVIALTRSHELPDPDPPGRPGVQWRAADLFSLLDVEQALEGATHAYYLVHSMLPSADLVQARFEDLDLILADNFARAAKRLGLRQVIYLGGLLPEGANLSTHLRSRFEVEETFRAYGVPFTAVRAGLVIGPQGSSFRILERLVRRLPLMLAPRWTQTPTQPIALPDLIAVLHRTLGDEGAVGRVVEVGGADVLSYRELMHQTARALGIERRILSVGAFAPSLSSLWVWLITRVPMQLIRPLVQSLKTPMVAHDPWYQKQNGLLPMKSSEAIALALQPVTQGSRPQPKPHAGWHRDVRSVQRLPLPAGWSAQDVAREYVRFLPKFMWPLIRVETDAAGDCRFFIKLIRRPLLVLSYSEARGTPDRQLFYITDGWLAKKPWRAAPRARFEFREVLDKRFVLTAIHAFRPALPWAIYKLSQAIVHAIVMRGFGRHLRKLHDAGARPALLPRLVGTQDEARPSRTPEG